MLASSLHEQTSGSTGPSKVRTLLALEGGTLKAPVLLTPGRWTIGCAAENHIVLQGPAVASRHGLIIASEKRVLFRSWSQDSRLNGVPVVDAELTAGHTLQIGLQELRLREAGSSELISQLPAVAECRAGQKTPVSGQQPAGVAASLAFDAAASVARIDILAQAVEALSDELLGRDHGTQRLDELAGQIEASLIKPAVVRPDAAMAAGEIARPSSMIEAGPGDSSATSSDALSSDDLFDAQQVSKAELRFRRRYEELHEYELSLAEREEELKQKLDQLHRAQAELARQRRDWTEPDTAYQDTPSSVPSSELPDDFRPQASVEDVSAAEMLDRAESMPGMPSECLAAAEPAAEHGFEFNRQCRADEQHYDEDLTEEQACFARGSDASAVQPADEAARSREEAVRQLDELLLSITGRSDADQAINAAAPVSAAAASPDSAVTSARPGVSESSDDVDQEIAATVERLQELEELFRLDLSDDITLESEFARTAGVSRPAAHHNPVDDESDFQCGRLSLSLPGFESDVGQDSAERQPEAVLEQNHQPRWDDVPEEDASHFSQRFQSRGFVFADESADLPQTNGEHGPTVRNSAAAVADAGDGSDDVIARSPLLASLLRSRPSESESMREVDAQDPTDAPHQSPATALAGEGAPEQPVTSLRHQLASLFNMPEPDSLPHEVPNPTEERSQSFIATSPGIPEASRDESPVSNESGQLPVGLSARTSNAVNEHEAPVAEERCETEEPSIQDYMQQLLARSRRQGGDQSPVVFASPVEPVVETPALDNSCLTDTDDSDKSWLQEGPLHAQDKKQVRERVAAFRDVANQSARAALIASRRRQLRIQVIVKCLAAVIALGSGIAALLAQLPKIFGYGVSALGLYFFLDLVVTLVRHGRKLIDYKAAARSKARLPAAKESQEHSPSAV